MIRASLMALTVASPACAAHIAAPQMEECGPVHTSPHQSIIMGQIKPHGTVWSCDWFAGMKNPLPHDMLADLKGWHPESAAAYIPVTAATAFASSDGAAWRGAWRYSGGAFASSSLAGAPSLFTLSSSAVHVVHVLHWPGCGCGACCGHRPPPGSEGPPEGREEPAPVPQPASAWLLLAGLAGLLVRRVRACSRS